MSRIIIVFAMLFTFNSCSKDKLDGSIQTNAALAGELRGSPVGVQIGNDSLFLTSSLSRDFMPTVPQKDHSGLNCSNQLTFKDSLPIPTDLVFRNQYVISGNQIWTNDHPAMYKGQPFIISGTITEGPKWDPAILVDVVCEFETGNKTYRIIIKQQKIEISM